MLGNVIVVISIPPLLLGKRSTGVVPVTLGKIVDCFHSQQVCCIPGSALKGVGDTSRRRALSWSLLGSVLTQVSPKVAEGWEGEGSSWNLHRIGLDPWIIQE